MIDPDSIAFWCPFCGVGPGCVCLDNDGTPVAPHGARAKARRATGQLALKPGPKPKPRPVELAEPSTPTGRPRRYPRALVVTERDRARVAAIYREIDLRAWWGRKLVEDS